MTTWEITDPVDCLTTQQFPGLVEENFPMLYPWIMVSSENNVQLWERNPYYHKVDAEGKQLPYIDYIQNTLVEDVEMVQMKVITGGNPPPLTTSPFTGKTARRPTSIP